MWPDCPLWPVHYGHDLEAALDRLQVTILDHLEGSYSEGRLKTLEDKWIVNFGTFFKGGSNSRNEVLSNQRRNWGSS